MSLWYEEKHLLKRRKKIVFLEPGWTGIDCSIDIDECKTIRPCKAAKTCINLLGSYKCECLDSFTGQNCETVRIIKSFASVFDYSRYLSSIDTAI